LVSISPTSNGVSQIKIMFDIDTGMPADTTAYGAFTMLHHPVLATRKLNVCRRCGAVRRTRQAHLTQVVTGSWDGSAIRLMDQGKFQNWLSIVWIHVVSSCYTNELVFHTDQY
jgi:hypothetical protein